MKESFEKALTADLRVLVDGQEVALSAEQKRELAKSSAAIREALPADDKLELDFLTGLNADQVALVKESGAESVEAWTPEALVARWRSEGRVEFERGRAAAELEIAVLAQRFLEKSRAE
jgi:hypothetical protein